MKYFSGKFLTAKKLVLFCILMGIHSISFSQDLETDPSLQRQKLKNTVIQNGYNYSLHYANENYLLYVENFLNELFLYNLKESKIEFRKKIPKGRGPGEANIITAGAIIGNKIYIADGPQFKIIEIDIDTGNYNEFVSRKIYSRSFSVFKNKLVIENNLTDKLFLLFDPKTEEVESLSFGKVDPYQEFENYFFKEGSFCLLDNKIVLSTYYRPHIYIFDVQKKLYSNKFEYDISRVSQPRKVDAGSSTLTLPPDDANIETEKIASVPGSSTNILLLLKGKGSNITYDLKHIYEFNIEIKKFVKKYPLNTLGKSMMSNSNFVYVYSEKDATIYQYKILK